MSEVKIEQLISRLYWNLFPSLEVLARFPGIPGSKIELLDMLTAIVTLSLADETSDDQDFCDGVKWATLALRQNIDEIVELCDKARQMPKGHEARSYSPVSKLLHRIVDDVVKEGVAIHERRIVSSGLEEHAANYRFSFNLEEV